MALIALIRRRAGQLIGDGQSLRGRMVRSASWLTVGYGIEMVLRLGSSLFLTRLLSPEAFGIMATAQVFLYTAVMLSDVGIRSLVITHDEADDPDFLRAVWTFELVRGVAIAVIVALFGQLLGLAQSNGFLSSDNSFAEPMLPAMIAVLGITLAIGGLKSTNEHIMARDLRQDILVKLEIGTKILSTIITVAAVWLTRSVWGFVYAALIVACFRSVLSFKVVPGPKMYLHWNRAHLVYMVNRGKWIGISSWTTLLSSLADKVLIGGYFGAHTLGLYSLALSLADALHSFMTQIANAISLPTIRELLKRSRSEFETKFHNIRNVVQLISSVVSICLAWGAPMLIETLYDDRYILAGTLLSVLVLKYAIFHLSFNCSVMEARQEFSALSLFNIIRTIILWASAYFLAANGQLIGLILIFSLNNLIERALASWLLVRRNVLSLRSEIQTYVLVLACLGFGLFALTSPFRNVIS